MLRRQNTENAFGILLEEARYGRVVVGLNRHSRSLCVTQFGDLNGMADLPDSANILRIPHREKATTSVVALLYPCESAKIRGKEVSVFPRPARHVHDPSHRHLASHRARRVHDRVRRHQDVRRARRDLRQAVDLLEDDRY
jgi:hypothetical protein